jgi:hypothetical protein
VSPDELADGGGGGVRVEPNQTTARKPGHSIIQYFLSTLVFLLFSSSVSFYYFGYIVFLFVIRFGLFFVNSLLDVGDFEGTGLIQN